jgi:hypothetical protein
MTSGGELPRIVRYGKTRTIRYPDPELTVCAIEGGIEIGKSMVEEGS